ncbi:hypothetical protein KI387_025432 [Taxus chinensis]|uniref:Pentatricopeptide repeat-containing protein n=1 Tax=Taxus chinensis TaxID=29808 RepID=A0AA38FT68_TAXCH|nr:hypothetical protein KI387_025432 [Taxus chinensis]
MSVPMPMPFTADLNLTALCRAGRLKEAVQILLTTNKPPVDSYTYVQLLQTCISKKALSQGEKIHSHISQTGFQLATHKLLQNTIISMYDKCGCLVDARQVFDQMTERDIHSWNIIIAAYRRHGFPHKSLTLFHQMQGTGIQPDQFTFASILPACAKIRALEQGIDIHQSIIENGFLSDVVVTSALVDMYVKCGTIHKARELFDKMPQKNVFSWTAMIVGYAQNGVLDEALRLFKEIPQRDVVSWTAIIVGYAQNGFIEKALETYKHMQLAGINPNSTTLASILPACAKVGAVKKGMDIHQSIIKRGFLLDVIVVNALIDMYAKCGSICKARELFDKMAQRVVVSWNALIAGYVHNGVLDEALRLFEEMPQRNVVSWTAIIAGYVQNGFVEKAFEIFKQMQLAGVKPNSTTFASILPACAKMGVVERGMDIHQRIIECGFMSDVIVMNALIDMYAKCGSTHKARELFDKMSQRDMASWTAMIAGYAKNGFVNETLRLFKEMPHRDVVSWNALIVGYAQNGSVEKAVEAFKQMQLSGVKPDSITFSSVLPACAKLGALEQGVDIHRNIIESGCLSDAVVANSLVDMYAKCGSIHKAREQFEKMPKKNVQSWTVMIAGYAQNGFSRDALKLFEVMKHSGIYPDHVSFACVLLACSHAGLVYEGCTYFNTISDSYCIMPTIDHYVCMVDLLGRAGYLEETLKFIIKMPIKPVVAVWTCLFGACRAHKNIGLGVFTATLVFELDPQNTATYVLLSNIYAEMGRWGEAQMVRRLMKDRGIKKIPGCSWIEGHKIVHAFCVGDRSYP